MMLSSAAAELKYGTPNKKGTGYLVNIKLPYPMYIAWGDKSKVTSIQCHQAVAASLLNIFGDILATYGLAKIQELGIDRYGGCFEYRKKVGKNSTSLSLHSWGIAVDLDPARNLYSETKKTARFARTEYKQMIDIFYKNGWESLGRERGYDYMHFQVKSDALLPKFVSAITSIVPITGSVKKKV